MAPEQSVSMCPQNSNWLSWHTFMGANAGRTFLRPFPSLYYLITGNPGSQDPSLWGRSLTGNYVSRWPVLSWTFLIASLIIAYQPWPCHCCTRDMPLSLQAI